MGRPKADGSPAVSTCRYHCVPCGQHFASLSAFDAHRSGPYDDRECLLPDEAFGSKGQRLLTTKPERGECRMIADHHIKNVEIVTNYLEDTHEVSE